MSPHGIRPSLALWVAGAASGTSFMDTGLADKTTYFYVVTASNSGGESGPSNEVSERTQ